MYRIKHNVACSYRKTFSDRMICFGLEWSFPITAHLKVLYSSCTRAICQRACFICYNYVVIMNQNNVIFLTSYLLLFHHAHKITRKTTSNGITHNVSQQCTGFCSQRSLPNIYPSKFSHHMTQFSILIFIYTHSLSVLSLMIIQIEH